MAQYTVKKGDTSWAIAKANNISLNELARLNPTIKDLNKISINLKINIPDAKTLGLQNEDTKVSNSSSNKPQNSTLKSLSSTSSKSESNTASKPSLNDKMRAWALDYFNWATSLSGGNRNAKESDLQLALKYLPSDKALRLRYIYDLGDDDTKSSDTQAVEKRNHELKVKLAWANSLDYVTKRGWDKDTMDEYKKMYDLSNDELAEIMAATYKNLREYNKNRDAAIAYRDRPKVPDYSLVYAMHDALNKFLSGAGDVIGAGLNATSHVPYGLYKVATDDNYSLRDWAEGMVDPSKSISASDIIVPGAEKGWGTMAADILFDPLTMAGGVKLGKDLILNGILIGRTLAPAGFELYGFKTNFRRMGNNWFNPVSGVPRYGRRGRPYTVLLTPEDDVTRLARGHYLENIHPTTQRPGLKIYSATEFMPGNLNVRYFYGYPGETPFIGSGATPFVNLSPAAKYIPPFPGVTGGESLVDPNEFVYSPAVNYRLEVTVENAGSPEFLKAFKKAREEGKTEFEFNGKIYTTDLGDISLTIEAMPTVSRPIPGDVVVAPTEAFRISGNPTIISTTPVYEPVSTAPIEGSRVYLQKDGGKINYLKHYK